MPRLRDDVQPVCYWIDHRIKKHGKPRCLQLTPGKLFSKTLFTLDRDRPRLPPKHESGYKGANNLMRIPAGSVLNLRFVTMGKEHYLRRFLDNVELCQKIGIFYVGGIPHLPIYEVIDGLAFAERRSDHMLAGYQSELDSLRNTSREARILIEDAMFRAANKGERQQLEIVAAMAEKRVSDIQAIIADHAYRQVNIHFAFERAKTRLVEMSVLLERVAFHIRTRNVRIGQIQRVGNQILSELPYFNSKEIQSLTRSVIIALKALSLRTDTGEYATFMLSDSLRKAADLLLQAVNLLQTESLKVNESEKNKADEIVKFGA